MFAHAAILIITFQINNYVSSSVKATHAAHICYLYLFKLYKSWPHSVNPRPTADKKSSVQ